MSLKSRVTAAERKLAYTAEGDYGPVTIIETLHGIRLEAHRRRLGREGCRLAAEKVRALIEESWRTRGQGSSDDS